MTSRFFRIRRLKTRFLPLLALMALLSILTASSSVAGPSKLSIHTDSTRHDFTVEVMRTQEDRARGLMYRKQMDANHGMLFDFGGNVIARMWMKNTFIPLDMLFIRPDGVIANIAANTVPHSTEVLSSEGEVRYVLEINGGLSEKLGISSGNRVILPSALP